MRKSLFLGALTTAALAALASVQTPAAEQTSPVNPDTRVYEMRTYYAAPGKLDALHARFRDHTTKLFEKHGMQNIGYWVPVENPENKLIYVLAYSSREAREKSWKAFSADPDWQRAYKASEANGGLVAKAESIFLQPTDYSPALDPVSSTKPRLFELRTYTAAPGRLNDLNKRFREHTTKLFATHGITNIGYWVPASDARGAENTLIYVVAHADKDSADQSWKAFRVDAKWTAAKSASEVNGPLTAPEGVKSVYMRATDYSLMR